jgi:hypothetical protein
LMMTSVRRATSLGCNKSAPLEAGRNILGPIGRSFGVDGARDYADCVGPNSPKRENL